MGTICAFIRWQGRIRSNHAAYRGHWHHRWLPSVLQPFDMWVIRRGPTESDFAANVVPVRFYGFSENQREREMDMREMVDKVKRNEPLYGKSTLSPYMQGVASRNSRYAGVWLHIIPWFNFVNHEQVGCRPINTLQACLLIDTSMEWTPQNITNKRSESSKQKGQRLYKLIVWILAQ